MPPTIWSGNKDRELHIIAFIAYVLLLFCFILPPIYNQLDPGSSYLYSLYPHVGIYVNINYNQSTVHLAQLIPSTITYQELARSPILDSSRIISFLDNRWMFVLEVKYNISTQGWVMPSYIWMELEAWIIRCRGMLSSASCPEAFESRALCCPLPPKVRAICLISGSRPPSRLLFSSRLMIMKVIWKSGGLSRVGKSRRAFR